jgi:hypothetical protein
VVHHHPDAVQPLADRAGDDAHAALALEIDGPPRIHGIRLRMPDECRLNVRQEPMRPASAPGHSTAKPRMPSRGLIDRLSQPLLLKIPLDDALEEETHRVPGPRIHQHEMIEWRQRFTDRGRRRGGLADGNFRAGEHGSRDDTLAARLTRINPIKQPKTAIKRQMANLTGRRR